MENATKFESTLSWLVSGTPVCIDMLAKEIENSISQTLIGLAQSGSFRTYAGDFSERLPAELSALLEVPECLLVSSGTAGLEIVLRAAGIGPGDEVLISAYDYPGNFWAIERVGAVPVLIDIEPNSWRISAEKLEAMAADMSGNACKAIVASHLHGQLQDASWLRNFSDQHDLLFLEDCCQAIGASIDGRPAGSFGHAAILSFGGGKLISAGRGGALLTADQRLAQKARLAAGAGSGPYAMSEIQAALVTTQLAWLPQLNECCRHFFRQLQRELRERNEFREERMIMPGAEQIESASFYQAGWVIGPFSNSPLSGVNSPTKDEPSSISQLIGTLRAARVPAGKGFEGFHRRSGRRCRTPFPLTSARSIVDRTLVVHHRAALDEELTPAEMAANILAGLADCG